MDDNEFKHTPTGKAMANFFEYIFTLNACMNQIDLGRAITLGGVNFLNRLAKNDEIDRDVHDPFVHALYIIGAWSSFEAFFDDFFIATLRSEPNCLDHERIKDTKVPIVDLLVTGDDKHARVYEALKAKSERRLGVSKFEDLLGCIGLSEPVPDQIKDAIYASQQIRHVWAHKAGRADSKFLQNAAHLGFVHGDRVKIDNTQARFYVQALFVYGCVILNRYRLRFGLLPINAGENAPNNPFQESYGSLYNTSERSELDMNGSPLNAPPA